MNRIEELNKIKVVEDILIANTSGWLILDDDRNIDIKGEVKLLNHNVNNTSLEVNIGNNANIDLDKIDIVTKDLSIDFNLENDSSLNLNWLIINNGKNKIRLNINMKGNNNRGSIKVRVINKNDNDNADLIVNGVVSRGTIGNVLVEDLKGLTKSNDTIKISPNIDVNTSEVEANHLVTIAESDPYELFYLESRGISRDKALELLESSFMFSILDCDLVKKFKE